MGIKNHIIGYIFAGLVLQLAQPVSVVAGPIPCSQCFPSEMLPPRVQKVQEEIFHEVFDEAGLYSAVGYLKPLTETIGTKVNRISNQLDAKELELLNLSLQCGDVQIKLSRKSDGWVIRTFQPEVMREKILEFPEVYLDIGITPQMSAQEVLQKFAEFRIRRDSIDVFLSNRRLSSAEEYGKFYQLNRKMWYAMHRAYGTMVGYPKHAIDFFVAADQTQDLTGQEVPRDFRGMKSVQDSGHAFVYAVPAGAKKNEVDYRIELTADLIFDEYAERLKTQKDGNMLSLIRDWYDDGNHQCSPDTAFQKVVINRSLVSGRKPFGLNVLGSPKQDCR